jgi:hypothetical protein
MVTYDGFKNIQWSGWNSNLVPSQNRHPPREPTVGVFVKLAERVGARSAERKSLLPFQLSIY